MTERDVYDITIIGAGPTGLFAAFYAGMRQARTQVIDSLEEPGGALDRDLSREVHLRRRRLSQGHGQGLRRADGPPGRARSTDHAAERRGRSTSSCSNDGILCLTTTRCERYSKTVIICAGVGAFEPKRIDAPGVAELEGKGVHYFAKRVDDFRERDVVIVGGGDSAVDWAVTLEPVASHVTLIHRSKFRAHEATVRELEEGRVQLRYPGCEIVEVHGATEGYLHAVSSRTRPARSSGSRPMS